MIAMQEPSPFIHLRLSFLGGVGRLHWGYWTETDDCFQVGLLHLQHKYS